MKLERRGKINGDREYERLKTPERKI